ncbi:MAG: hypothetical protein ACXVCY_13380 [Pseudobdellovibrionaceae bacterium]
MKSLARISTIILLIILQLDSIVWSVENKTENLEEALTQCYKQFPLLFQSLMLISDQDYANKSKAKIRAVQIKKDYEKSPTQLRDCVDKVKQYALDQNDLDNLKFVTKRTKEFSSVVYSHGSRITSKPKLVR